MPGLPFFDGCTFLAEVVLADEVGDEEADVLVVGAGVLDGLVVGELEAVLLAEAELVGSELGSDVAGSD